LRISHGSTPLAPPKRYYPGFFAALFLVLLRTAIGWHFLYEGWEKVNPSEGKPFTAEPYLRNAVGPFAPKFRQMVPDVDSKARLVRDAEGRPARLKEQWKAELDRLANHYGFSADQRSKADDALKTASATADAWFRNLENAQNIQKYLDDTARIERIESDREALDYQRKLAYKQRNEVEKERRDLIQPIEAWTGALRDAWMKLVRPEQQKARGPLVAEPTELDLVNELTKYGMVAAGAGLILGLFTRLSALGAAAFLVMFYLSMPPWPGLPEGPKVEGHYLYVNKNLIELLACLALACMRTGLWLGLDAVVFGRYARRRDARAFARWRQADAEAAALAHEQSPDPYSDPRELRRRGIAPRRERR
jgi:uncharacterized membrane protein YphA (DoxX/SURF4 family)